MQYDDDEDVLIAPQVKATAGQLLREARQSLELTIEAVADELRLTPQLISDLENDTPDPRYKPTFVRGYYRAYARYVGLSPALIVERYEAQQMQVQSDSANKFTKAISNVRPSRRKEGAIYRFVQGLIETFSEPLRPPVIGAITVCIVGVLYLSFAPKDPTIVFNLPSEEGQNIQQIASQVQSTPRSSAATPSIARAEQVVTNSQHAVLKVSFTDSCWITVFDGNHARLATGIRDAGSPLLVEGVPPLRIMLGNPKVASLTFNGDVIDLDVPVKDEMVNLTLG
jgi:cytoskeleton protein RodZ